MYIEKFYTPFIGQTGPQKKIYISSEDTMRFAKAIGEEDLCYYDEEYAKSLGYEGIIAPPTFTKSIILDPVPGVWEAPYGRIYATQEFKYHKPLVADRWYYAHMKLADAYEKEGKKGLMVFVITECEFFDENMDLVISTLATGITRGELFSLYNEKEENKEIQNETDTKQALDNPYFVNYATINVGDPLPAFEANEIDRYSIIKYGGVSHDFNPIHFIDEAAAKVKYKSLIAHGMLNYSIATHVQNIWFGGREKYEPINVKARFTNPCYLGERPIFTGVITKIDRTNRIITADFAMKGNDGSDILTGSFSVRIK